MRKEVIDLQDLRPELDEKDKELFSMFAKRREWNVNDMVLIRQGEELYLEKKADIAIRQKRRQAVIQWLVGLVAGTCLIFEFVAVLQGSRAMWLWWGMFIVCAVPALCKVPQEVRQAKAPHRGGEKEAV